jgi:hypothetical protein
MEKYAGVGREEKRKLWEERIQEWRSGGLSQSAYCRKAGVSIESFKYWKKKLSGDNALFSLVELPGYELSPLHHSSQPLYLEVRGVYRIAIERGFDADTLHELLRILDR